MRGLDDLRLHVAMVATRELGEVLSSGSSTLSELPGAPPPAAAQR
ncbi:hypothetical protein [Pseudoclavibacter endophyticus]|nr:hypothetical protein [Pseudoclavibacter endophyticus]